MTGTAAVRCCGWNFAATATNWHTTTTRDVEADRRRLDVAGRHLRFDEVVMNERGILGALRRTQNDPPQHHEHYTAAIAALADGRSRVAPGRVCLSCRHRA